MNKKRWRPKDWKLIGVSPIDSVHDDVKTMLLKTTYERGADAMLSALLKWTEEICDEHPIDRRITDDYGSVVNCETCEHFAGQDCDYAETAVSRGWSWHDLFPKECSEYKYEEHSFPRRDCDLCWQKLKELEMDNG